MNKRLFAKADSLVINILSFPRIRLSNLHTLILVGVESGVLLSDFAHQLRRKNADVPELCFTLLDAAGVSWYIFNTFSESKCQSQRDKAGFLSKFERQKLKDSTYKAVLHIAPREI